MCVCGALYIKVTNTLANEKILSLKVNLGLDKLSHIALTIERKETSMRDAFTLDRIIKNLAGKLVAGTITQQEMSEYEHAQAERRQGQLKPPHQLKQQQRQPRRF